MPNMLAPPLSMALRTGKIIQPWEYWRTGRGSTPITMPKPPIADGDPTISPVSTPTPTLAAGRSLTVETPVPTQTGVKPVAPAPQDTSAVLFRLGTVAVTRQMAGIAAAILGLLILARRKR